MALHAKVWPMALHSILPWTETDVLKGYIIKVLLKKPDIPEKMKKYGESLHNNCLRMLASIILCNC